MTGRLVLFGLFLALIAGVLSLGSYKKVFDSNETLDLKMIAEAKKMTEAKNNPQKKVAKKEKEEPEEYKLVLDTPEMKKAHEIYHNVGQCVRCHGENGQGVPEEGGPLIAGQHDWYVIDQLRQMKTGSRNNEKMKEFIQNLSDQDFQVLATYIEKLRVR
jgi:cytochrome c553